MVCLWCGRTEGGTGVRSRDYQNFSDGLPNFSRYRALACACASLKRGASLSVKQEVVLDFYKAFKNHLLALLVLIHRTADFHVPLLVKSLPFYIPEAEKRCPLRAEIPRTGHYTEYPPDPLSRMLSIYCDSKEKEETALSLPTPISDTSIPNNKFLHRKPYR